MQLYNTLIHSKENFIPLEENKVKIYICGPTVYDFCHIGNARPLIVFDVLRRYLEYKGYNVVYVQNFTDVDDKIIKKSIELKKDFLEISNFFIKEYFIDADKLNIKRANFYPRASENIEQIINFIEILIKKEYAYEVKGNVYFSAKKFNDYGKLSGQKLFELESGVRIKLNNEKREAFDFALWKARKNSDPYWDSPWSEGRPGWHIECSAMVKHYLGKTIDIHCGGQDLIFPHHENEIAQSECANNQKFVRFWLHNGHVNINNKKMSKSLGNTFAVRNVAKDFGYETIRFFMLMSHYRSPLNFSVEAMNSARLGLERLYNCLENLSFLSKKACDNPCDNQSTLEKKLKKEINILEKKFFDNLNDDLNTAGSISALFDLISTANKNLNTYSSKSIIKYFVESIRKIGKILGIFDKEKKRNFSDEIKKMLDERKESKINKNWVKSDDIRMRLEKLGILINDTPQGQHAVWKDFYE
ncbi:MAG: cysteine--tRNA ligase [Clostridiales bacterium]|jgi:cysteinyl-tRNA synthetase|nr:cysteine--tRNA ligase [Clostridiales bacterium]